ncbi:S1 domain-containing protein [Glaciimonas soli]|uniref:Cold-shock protein n=1 Tax=Glaciimonas soli TaxID=2590999 RepID=A0A843YWW9_9BURK|nr:cold shock domain-containing protein [Glaciimonas soli]MQR02487.1 cold-shock protein [Glaciimonas soli]
MAKGILCSLDMGIGIITPEDGSADILIDKHAISEGELPATKIGHRVEYDAVPDSSGELIAKSVKLLN